MQRSRFVFLAAPMQATQGAPATDGILWILMSPNNRPLGRGPTYHRAYADCRQSVLDLQANFDRIRSTESTVEMTGQWSWRIDLDGASVAVSSRSYLRARECTYNLDRFMAAARDAELVAGVRAGRRGGRRTVEAEPVAPARPWVLGTGRVQPALGATRLPPPLGTGRVQPALGPAYRPAVLPAGEVRDIGGL